MVSPWQILFCKSKGQVRHELVTGAVGAFVCHASRYLGYLIGFSHNDMTADMLFTHPPDEIKTAVPQYRPNANASMPLMPMNMHPSTTPHPKLRMPNAALCGSSARPLPASVIQHHCACAAKSCNVFFFINKNIFKKPLLRDGVSACFRPSISIKSGSTCTGAAKQSGLLTVHDIW